MRIWPFLLLGACVTNHTIQVDSLMDETTSWAQGTEVVVSGWVYGEAYAERASIDQLDLSPDGLASTRRIDDQHFAIRTVAAGTLHVHFEVAGDDGEREFKIVPATLGPIHVAPSGAPGHAAMGVLGTLPPELTPRPTEIGVYAPEHVMVEYPIVDASGKTLAGDPIQPWTPMDRLTPIDAAPRTEYDLAPDTTPVTVSVGGDALSFVAVEPSSVARIALLDTTTGTLYDGTSPIPAPMVDVWYEGTQLSMVAFDANDRLLVGPHTEMTAVDAFALDVEQSGSGFVISGRKSGSSSFALTCDNLTTTFPTVTP